MIQLRTSVSELDLLAYADGLLEGHPQRKQAIEAYLAGAPDAAARVARIKRQNEALRTTSDSILSEDLPAALTTFGARAKSNRIRNARYHLSIAAMLLIAAGLGWFLGETSGPKSIVSETLLGEVAEIDARLGDDAVHSSSPMQVATAGVEDLVPAATNQTGPAIQLVPPDLSDLGFRYTGMRFVRSGKVDLVQLSYQVLGTSDQSMRLYIGPAEAPFAKKRASVEGRERTLHYWRSGPFSVVTTFSGETPLSNRLLDRLMKEQPLLQVLPQSVRETPLLPSALNALSLPADTNPGSTVENGQRSDETSLGPARFN